MSFYDFVCLFFLNIIETQINGPYILADNVECAIILIGHLHFNLPKRCSCCGHTFLVYFLKNII